MWTAPLFFYLQEINMRESERKLNESFDKVEAAFDRWDAAADRVERKLIMMPFVVVGSIVVSSLLARYFF
jgi:hypothetical protein